MEHPARVEEEREGGTAADQCTAGILRHARAHCRL